MASHFSLRAYHLIVSVAGSWAVLCSRKTTSNATSVPVLSGLALGIGILSTLATAFAFFWFVQMRRSFRHDLIMLLVQADFVKSLPYVVFPIVQFVRGPVSSGSAFCQASGFVLALGIEASDVAVLLIAVHSVMYIHRPRSGLYPYRWLSYGAYMVIPILFAGLAFADGGYENLGSYCYLSKDHGWSRMALSWIPRYVLLICIVIIYAYVYGYVHTKLGGFGRKHSTNQMSTDSSQPPLDLDKQRNTPSGVMLTPFRPNESTGRQSQVQGHGRLGHDGTYSMELSASLHEHDRSRSVTEVPSCACSSRRGSWKRTETPLTSGIALPSFLGLGRTSSEAPITLFHDTPDIVMSDRDDTAQLGEDCSILASMAPATLASTHNEPDLEVDRNRERIRRQLRSLFVYPLIYLLTWIFPLVNQAYGQARPAGTVKPLWLRILSLIGFAIQGFTNSTVFTTHEKPWRHGGGRGFWKGVRRKLAGGSVVGGGGGVGRTRDEILVERDNARARRAEEIAAEGNDGMPTAANSIRPKVTRNWWDTNENDVDLTEHGSRE